MNRILDSVIDNRRVEDGLYKIELQINEKDFNHFYDDIDEESAVDFVRTYLDTKADDGRPTNIQIHHEKNTHVVRITADIHYTGNEFTEFINRHRDSTFD